MYAIKNIKQLLLASVCVTFSLASWIILPNRQSCTPRVRLIAGRLYTRDYYKRTADHLHDQNITDHQIQQNLNQINQVEFLIGIIRVGCHIKLTCRTRV